MSTSRKAQRVLIADDRLRSRKGLKALLATFPGVEVVGEARDGREAVYLADTCQPDVVLLDVRMPNMNGIDATLAIKASHPEIRVVILTIHPIYRFEALDAGADGFLIKGCPSDDLLDAIRGQGRG